MTLLRAFVLMLALTSQLVASDPLGDGAEAESLAAEASCVCSLDATGAGVCGADGNTYANECLAACSGVAVVAPGACAVHATTKLFAPPGPSAASTPTPTPLGATLVNRYAAEGFRLVGRAEATAVIGRATPPPEPTGVPVDPNARYAALRLDVATGLLYSSNGSRIAEQASLTSGDQTLETPEGRPTKRHRQPRRQAATDVATEAGIAAVGAPMDASAAAAATAASAEPPSADAATILGADTRSQVTAIAFPYTAVVALQGSTWCSGSMVNTHAVLTSAHCVYSSSGWINLNNLVVAPGAYRPCSTCATRFPCGTVPVRTVTTYSTYTSTFNAAYDIAVIRLNNDVGGCTGWFGMQATTTGTFSGTLNTAGYPGDKLQYAMHWTSQTSVADTRSDFFIEHNLDTVGGQSGSPLWTLINGNRQIRAVHGYGTGGSWTLNRGVAIYNTDFNNINAWGA